MEKYQVTSSFTLVRWTCIAVHPTNPNYIIVLNESANRAESIQISQWESFHDTEILAAQSLISQLRRLADFTENQYTKK